MEASMSGAASAQLQVEFHGTGPSLLLIHGTGADAALWGAAVKDLARGHHVIAYDRRGHSRSKHAPVRDYRVHVMDAAALLRQHAPSGATVIGWSSGGTAALGLAIREPALVRKLILVEALFQGLRNATPSLLAGLGRVNALRLAGRPQRAVEEFYRWAFRYTTGGSAFDKLDEAARDALMANAPSVLAEATRPHLHGALGEDLSGRAVRGLAMPVSFLLAEASDPWFHQMHAALVRLIPTISTRQVAGAGHAIHLDEPSALMAAATET
jgi:pimeloyl-ACP methyl ester carboxylesterase